MGDEVVDFDDPVCGQFNKSYFIRRIGSDGFKIGYQPTMKKIVNDRRASLDETTETKPAMQSLTASGLKSWLTISA